MSEEVSRSGLDLGILERNMHNARSEYQNAEKAYRKSVLESNDYQKEEEIAKRKFVLSLRAMDDLSNKDTMSEHKYSVCVLAKNKLEFEADSHEDAAKQYIAKQKSREGFSVTVSWAGCTKQFYAVKANAETGECTLGERQL